MIRHKGVEMRIIFIGLIVMFVLSACRAFPVYEYGVSSSGKQIYLVRADSYSRDKAKSAVLNRANEFCNEKGLTMEPTSYMNEPAWKITVKNKHDVELTFQCL